MQIPTNELSPEALNGLIEEFVSRQGTDYGKSEASFDSKKSDVRRQLDRGDALVVFDQESESCNIVRKEDAK